MTKTEDSRLFARRMFYRFLIPSLVMAFSLSFRNIVDSLVIGQRMQEEGLTAVSLTLPIYMIYNVLDIALNIDGSMVCTQLLTAGDAEKAREQFTQVTVLNLLISMPFVLLGLFGTPLAVRLLGASPDQVLIYPLTYQYAQILLLSAPLFFMNMLLYSYIRVDSGEVRASVGFVAGTAVDFVLNFVFVLGFDLGVRGAILATVAGQILSILIYSGHFFGKKHILRFHFKGFRLDLREMRRCFWIGLSGSVRYALISVLLLRSGFFWSASRLRA